jgi:pantoate kinase
MNNNRRSRLLNRIEADQLPHGSGLADVVAEHAGGAAARASSVPRMRIVVVLPTPLRIIQEAVTNVVRHTASLRILCRLTSAN